MTKPRKPRPLKKYPDYTDFNLEEINYGLHQYGFGPYRMDFGSGRTTHWWIDWPESTPNEKEAYRKFLAENGFESKEATDE